MKCVSCTGQKAPWYLLEEVEGLEKFCGDIRDIFARLMPQKGGCGVPLLPAWYLIKGRQEPVAPDQCSRYRGSGERLSGQKHPMLHLSSVAAIGKNTPVRGHHRTEQMGKPESTF